MHDITAIAAATPGSTRNPNFLKHQRHFPTIHDLRRGARAGCRISPTNMATAAPATTSASAATGRRSMPSSWCRAMA